MTNLASMIWTYFMIHQDPKTKCLNCDRVQDDDEGLYCLDKKKPETCGK